MIVVGTRLVWAAAAGVGLFFALGQVAQARRDRASLQSNGALQIVASRSVQAGALSSLALSLLLVAALVALSYGTQPASGFGAELVRVAFIGSALALGAISYLGERARARLRDYLDRIDRPGEGGEP